MLKKGTKTRRDGDGYGEHASASPGLAAFIVAVLTVCILLYTRPPASRAADRDASFVSTTTRDGRLAVFDDVWETIQSRYYDPTFRGIDWNATRAAFRPAAAEAGGTQEFYEVLRRMIASLRDAHTRVYSPEEKFDWWNPRFVTAGLTIREIEAVPTVVQVEPGSDPDRAGIHPGDVIVSIDDIPAFNLIERRLHSLFVQSSLDFARFRAIAKLLDGPPATSARVSWQTRQGKLKAAVLQRHWTQRRLGLHVRRKGNVAILELEAFTQAVALDFARALPKAVHGVQGIILDMRSNGGGDAEAMAEIASAFLGDGVNLGRFADRSGASFELQTISQLLSPAAPFTQTKLPLVVLTSESTSSAAEILGAVLQTKQRALVIGTGTCGCVLAIRSRHTLPDGGILDVSEFDYRTAEGLRLEGVGVKPNEPIKLKRNDLYSRRDRAVETALMLLKNSRPKT
jgi:carboxyl-terminal processing protease